MRDHRRGVLFLCAFLATLALLAHVLIGSSVWISPSKFAAEVFSGIRSGEAINDIIWMVRLPRACGCILVGAILGIVGAAFQSLFKNPLAEPYLVGVSSGASVGGAIAFVAGFGMAFAGFGSMVFAAIGGLGSMWLVIWIATRRGGTRVDTLILAGVVVGALLSALLTIILLMAGQDTNRVLRWLLGSMSPMYWNRLAILFVCAVVGFTILYRLARVLNALAVSEVAAKSMGIDVSRLKTRVLATGTVLTSISVGVVGIIGFLGLVAPHIARKLLGVDLRHTLLGAAMLGSACLLFADLIAQRAVTNFELPVGAVTAMLGAPSLILLMRRTD